MHPPRHLFAACLAAIVLLPAAHATADDSPKVTIIDEQGMPHELSAVDLAKMPRKTVTLPDEPGTTIQYQGVQLADVLEHCGVKLGKECAVTTAWPVTCWSKLRTITASCWRSRKSIPPPPTRSCCWPTRATTPPLPEREGPFRLVIPDDKRPVRWIRMIKRISIRKASTD